MGKTAVSRRPANGIRVLVADDHPVVRHGLRHILAETPDIVVVDEASTGSEVLGKLRRRTCDVLLLDLVLPDGQGPHILESVKREWPELPVLVVSMQPADEYAVCVLRAGAGGYMSKDCAADELVGAIRTIYAGGRYVTHGVAQALLAELDRTVEVPAHQRLSNREYQVLCMIGRALSGKEIATKLRLSEKTVSTYRGRLLQKLQARSTAELIRYAVQNRLAD